MIPVLMTPLTCFSSIVLASSHLYFLYWEYFHVTQGFQWYRCLRASTEFNKPLLNLTQQTAFLKYFLFFFSRNKKGEEMGICGRL